jgi:hypothetical protein
VAESDYVVCNENNMSTLLGIFNGYLEHSGEKRKIIAIYDENDRLLEFKLADQTL